MVKVPWFFISQIFDCQTKTIKNHLNHIVITVLPPICFVCSIPQNKWECIELILLRIYWHIGDWKRGQYWALEALLSYFGIIFDRRKGTLKTWLTKNICSHLLYKNSFDECYLTWKLEIIVQDILCPEACFKV